MAGRIAPPARPPSGLTYFINVTRRLSHLCIDAVNGFDQLPLLKISQTGGEQVSRRDPIAPRSASFA